MKRWLRDGDFLICPECESEIDIKNSLGVENAKNYSPNCGARMDGRCLQMKVRKIEFRGKRVRNGEWVYGSLIDGITGAVPVIVTTQNVDDSFRLEFDYDHVYPETVGQYTGLTDKNGKRIFESDIVRYEDAEADFEGYHDNVFMNIGVVYLDQWSGVTFSNRQTVEMDDLYDSETSIDAVVIGNIHDNPELLGGADNGE